MKPTRMVLNAGQLAAIKYAPDGKGRYHLDSGYACKHGVVVTDGRILAVLPYTEPGDAPTESVRISKPFASRVLSWLKKKLIRRSVPFGQHWLAGNITYRMIEKDPAEHATIRVWKNRADADIRRHDRESGWNDQRFTLRDNNNAEADGDPVYPDWQAVMPKGEVAVAYSFDLNYMIDVLTMLRPFVATHEGVTLRIRGNDSGATIVTRSGAYGIVMPIDEAGGIPEPTFDGK